MTDDDEVITLGLRSAGGNRESDAELPSEESKFESSDEPHSDSSRQSGPPYVFPALILGVVGWFVGGWFLGSSELGALLLGGLWLAYCWRQGKEAEQTERQEMLDSISPKKRRKFLRKEQEAKERREHEMALAKATRRPSGFAIVGWVVVGLLVFFIVLPAVFGIGSLAACLALLGG